MQMCCFILHSKQTNPIILTILSGDSELTLSLLVKLYFEQKCNFYGSFQLTISDESAPQTALILHVVVSNDGVWHCDT